MLLKTCVRPRPRAAHLWGESAYSQFPDVHVTTLTR